MHIHHRSEDGRALVSLPVKWEDSNVSFPEMSPDGKPTGVWLRSEFRVVHGPNVYRAVRCRSGYGWSTFEVYLNGVLISPVNGSDLLDHLEVYVPLEDALKGGCHCGCCIPKAERAEYFALKDKADKLDVETYNKSYEERAPARAAREAQEAFWQAAVAKSQEVK
jgi:hypothetical protein